MDFDNLISTEELAQATGLTVRRIQQLAPDLIAQGLAKRIGRPLVCDHAAIEYINGRSDPEPAKT